MNDFRSTFLSDLVFDTPKFHPRSAWSAHVPFAFWLVSQLKPRRFVELGTHVGVSYFAICQAVHAQELDCACTAIGQWEDDGETLDTDEVFQSVQAHNQEHYAAFSEILRTSKDKALTQVDDGSVDLLHIDGCHSQEEVEPLFKSWQPKLSDRAVVLFHGTAVSEKGSGVLNFWPELDDKYPSFTFGHGEGLGLFAVGQNMEPALEALFSDPDGGLSQSCFRRLFASLGNSVPDPESTEKRQQAALHLADENERMRQSSEVLVNHNALEVAKLIHEREELADELRQANIEVARARNRPVRLLRDKIAYKALRTVLKLGPFLPERRLRRLRKSAIRRDPKRSIRVAGFALHAYAGRTKSKKVVPLSSISRRYDPAKPTVLVIDRDASGAEDSVLVLNVARELSKKYNVVSMLCRVGPLSDHLAETSVATIEFGKNALSLNDVALAIKGLQEKFEFKYALTNSAVSRYVLMALRDANIPSTVLIHDFASGLLPITTVPEIFANSDSVVFSSEETLRDAISDALSHAGLGRPSNASIINPGRYCAPADPLTDEERRQEIAWLDGVLGQGSEEDDTFVVVGAGDVEMRKGLDLFIDVANRTVNSQTGRNFRFVWFGTGYDPIRERGHSIFLADQVLRAGLRGHLKIVRPTTEMEYVLEKADALLLSSRLDPFPNAAIDAVLNRTPVLCFDRATGFADFLKYNGIGEACVAGYLDTADMAQKLIALAQNDDLQTSVADTALSAGRLTFDLSKYVEKLDAIASQTIPAGQQVQEDVEFLKAGADFRPDFFWHKETEADIGQQIEEYLIASRSGIVARKPMPGFHPAIYAENNGSLTGTDPFVEFLKAGKPDGPWLLPVVDETSDIDVSAVAACSAALHLHVFYVEGLTEILHRLSGNAIRPDLFISTSASKVDAVKEALERYDGQVAKIEVVPNRGRDIGPFLTVFGKELAANYEFIGHLHTKKSPHVSNFKAVEAWSNFLLENMIGGELGGAMLDRILTRMVADKDVGIVYPDEPNISGWKENEGAARGIAERLQITRLPMQFNFPAGSMCWMRSSVLDRFVSLDMGWCDFPSEPLPHHDGTVLHAIERLFGVIPETMSMKTVVTNVRGVTR